MDKISIVIPCFNEEEAIPVYYMEMKKIMKEMSYVGFELFFVDDGSSDRTLQELRALSDKDERCNYLSFSRNFGKEAAIYAGLSHITGNYGVVMDVDLQDPPALLAKMYELLQSEDWDCVATKRGDRKGEPKIRSFLSDSFYKVINKMSKTEIVNGARDFRMMKRTMVDAVLSMSEYNRFSKGIFQWVGFRTTWLEFPNTSRCAGTTKWSFTKAGVLLIGRDYRFFCSSLVIGICGGNYFLWNFFSVDYFYHYSYIGIWRSCSGLAFFSLYLVFCKWNSIILYRNCRAISVKNLFGNKTQTSLYFKGVP